MFYRSGYAQHRFYHQLSHLAAGFGAPAASLGALFAMVRMTRVFFTLGGAGFADLGAKFTDVSRIGTATGHERNGSVADFGAVAVEPDAVYHHLYVLLAEAGFKAGIAGNGASLAGFDTISVRWGR